MNVEELNEMGERLQVIERHNAKQDEAIDELQNDVNGIRDDLKNHHSELVDLKEDVQKLEVIIVQENKETRTILESMLNKQWDLIMSRDMAKGVFTNKLFDLLFKMFSVGGIVYLLVERLIN